MKRYLNRTDVVTQLLRERDKLCEYLRKGYKVASHEIAGINSALRIVEQMDTLTIVHCRDCKHWHTGSSSCPMCHDEWYDDDGWTEVYTVDQTPDDGSGFCHMGKKYNKE